VNDNLNDADQLRWEARLLERARRGDGAAFGELYHAYSGRLFSRVLLPRLGNRDAAEDALSETFRTAYERLNQFEPRGVSIYFWISRIAVNKAADMHRAKGTTGRALASFEELLAPLIEPAVEPEEALAERNEVTGLRDAVREVLDRLNPRYAEAIRLRFFDEKSREECAVVMNVKLGTFDVLLLRALRAFRKEWPEPGQET
jgi:RNA polymerase sigma-70 factor (ECF subfamily)